MTNINSSKYIDVTMRQNLDHKYYEYVDCQNMIDHDKNMFNHGF